MNEATAQTTTASETKRDRVRRILITPLTDQGMRYPKATATDVVRKRLDRMADDLAYMTDDGLVCLRSCLRRQGEGTARNFWPSRVTYLGFAHSFDPRNIDDHAELLGWFISAAGAEAAAVPGRLVAEYEFWCNNWRPPYSPKDKMAVTRKASENAERLTYCEAREGDGRLRDPDAIAWLRLYRATLAKVQGWIEQRGAA